MKLLSLFFLLTMFNNVLGSEVDNLILSLSSENNDVREEAVKKLGKLPYVSQTKVINALGNSLKNDKIG